MEIDAADAPDDHQPNAQYTGIGAKIAFFDFDVQVLDDLTLRQLSTKEAVDDESADTYRQNLPIGVRMI